MICDRPIAFENYIARERENKSYHNKTRGLEDSQERRKEEQPYGLAFPFFLCFSLPYHLFICIHNVLRWKPFLMSLGKNLRELPEPKRKKDKKMGRAKKKKGGDG